MKVVDIWKKQHSVSPQPADIAEGVLKANGEFERSPDVPNHYLFFEGFLWGSGVYQWGKIYPNSIVKRIDTSGGRGRIYTEDKWLFREMDAFVIGTSSPLAKVAFPNYKPVVRDPDHLVIRVDYPRSQGIPLESFKVEGNPYIEKVQITDNKYVFLDSGEYAWIFSTPAFARKARTMRNASKELLGHFEKLIAGSELKTKLDDPYRMELTGLCSRKSPEETILAVDEDRKLVLWDDNDGYGFHLSDTITRASEVANRAVSLLDIAGVEALADPGKMFEWVHGRVQGDIIENHIRSGAPIPGFDMVGSGRD